jgi:hypothetical protein
MKAKIIKPWSGMTRWDCLVGKICEVSEVFPDNTYTLIIPDYLRFRANEIEIIDDKVQK